MNFSTLASVLLAAQQPGMLDMPTTCAVAIHMAIRQVDKDEGRVESSRNLLDMLTKYSITTCFESRKEKRRWIVIFAPGGLGRDGGLVYVVEPDLETRRVKSVPCEDHPEPMVCE